MKTIFVTMAALAALSAAPAAAQPWNGSRTSSGELQARIDAGVQSGVISRRELVPLRNDLLQLAGLERQFAANGISGRERSVLQQQGNDLRRQIDVAERNGRYDTGRNESDRYNRERQASQDARYGSDRRAAWEAERARRAEWDARNGQFDQFNQYGLMSGFDLPNAGDRFAGDARVGQRVSSRMVVLPVRYRDEFRDSAEVYYRYDDDRIYRVDRSTNTILSLLDLPN